MPSSKTVRDSAADYVGRFAPSPSGPLHFGSLVCALASFLDARKHSGTWLVRIEDIDPPREQTGADLAILNCLQQHGLHWDEEPLYQSARSDAYFAALAFLDQQGLSYRCSCTRKRLSALNHVYDGHCRNLRISESPAAIRLNTMLANPTAKDIEVEDIIQSSVRERFEESGDFIILRKDGLFAYQLAVTVDDIEQGITHVVRGYDLCDSTPKQVLLFDTLGAVPPAYAHIPVVVDTKGHKLSKQNHAEPVDSSLALANLRSACQALCLQPPESCGDVDSLLNWAVDAWDVSRLKNQTQIFLADCRLV